MTSAIGSTLRCWLNLGAIDSSPRFWLQVPLIGAIVSDATTAPHIQRTLSKLGSSMNVVEIEQKSYEMPPREGISIAHLLTVTDIERSARYYERRSSALAF